MSIGAGVISIGFILYRLFGSIFGLTLTGDAISELSLPIGVALVAGAVAGYHGGQLRRDQSLRAGIDTAGDEAAAAPSRTLLRLTGPPGAEAESMLAALRQHLLRRLYAGGRGSATRRLPTRHNRRSSRRGLVRRR